jgi:hypothetical protein
MVGIDSRLYDTDVTRIPCPLGRLLCCIAVADP